MFAVRGASSGHAKRAIPELIFFVYYKGKVGFLARRQRNFWFADVLVAIGISTKLPITQNISDLNRFGFHVYRLRRSIV